MINNFHLIVYILFIYIVAVVVTRQTYRGATGFSLLKFLRIKLELWYFPAGFAIEEHKHPNEYIKTIRVFGEAIFYRNRHGIVASHNAKWYNFKKFTYNIHNYDYHWFVVGKKMPMIAINFEYWYSTPTSASKDIQYKQINFS